jgi:hypothetical protein
VRVRAGVVILSLDRKDGDGSVTDSCLHVCLGIWLGGAVLARAWRMLRLSFVPSVPACSSPLL